MKASIRNLSEYTIAKNCSDIYDINAGIEEINFYLNNVKKPKITAYIRLYKLASKKKKLEFKKTKQIEKILKGQLILDI